MKLKETGQANKAEEQKKLIAENELKDQAAKLDQVTKAHILKAQKLESAPEKQVKAPAKQPQPAVVKA